MTDDTVIFKMETAYTLSQYRCYNRTVQRENRINNTIYLTGIGNVVIGILFSYFLKSYIPVIVFTALGIFNTYINLRGIEKAEYNQYQAEQLVGTITYEFREDCVTVTTHDGSHNEYYDFIMKVLENSKAFYLMSSDQSGLIVPKEDCPPGLEDFIRERFPVKPVKDVKI